MLIPIDTRPVVRDVVHKHPIHMILVLCRKAERGMKTSCAIGCLLQPGSGAVMHHIHTVAHTHVYGKAHAIAAEDALL
jgi:hypothetical protein